MCRRICRKWRNNRNELKNDLWNIMNPTLATAIIRNYIAYHDRTHLSKLWEMLGHRHREAWDEYRDTLLGKVITGTFEFIDMMYWIDKDFYTKHNRKVPGVIAIGDSLAVAYRYMREIKNNK